MRNEGLSMPIGSVGYGAAGVLTTAPARPVDVGSGLRRSDIDAVTLAGRGSSEARSPANGGERV
jgi:hypothetical protein